jgi:sulfite reductase alpha subunit-like flavoprotein
MVVFYGSQTGTAEDYALRFAKEANKLHDMKSMVANPETFDMVPFLVFRITYVFLMSHVHPGPFAILTFKPPGSLYCGHLW